MSNDWILELSREKLLKLLLIGDELGTRTSDLFLKQLQLGISNDSLHSQMVMEEIFALEGRGKSRTRAEEPFRGKHLIGLHKKHFYQTGFIGRNLQNEWKMQSKKSTKFASMVQRNLRKNRDPLKASQQIAGEFVKALSERERRQDLDGEWIVFAKHDDKNYYLTLAHHRDGDEEIRNSILGRCGKQFDFIREILVVSQS